MIHLQQRGKVKRSAPKRNAGKLLVIAIVMLYFLSRMVPLIKASGSKTYIAEYGKIEEIIMTTGYVARDEKVFCSVGKGEAKYFIAEGKKVAKNQKLAEIYLKSMDENLFTDLEIINLRIQNIKEKQSNQQLFQNDIQKIDNQIHAILKKIQFDIKNGNFGKVQESKNELESLLDKKNVIVGQKSFVGRNLAQLEQQKLNLENKIKNSIQTIYSEYPGIVALGSDGLEELINLKSIESITTKDLKLFENAKLEVLTKEIKKDSPVIRMIRSHRWSIICKLSEQEVSGMAEGKRLKVKRQGYNREYSATVRKIIREGNENIVILDLTEFMDDYYNLRTLKIEIVKDRYEGIKLRNQSIVEKNGQLGVYVVNTNGTTKFVPIKIKGKNEDCSIAHIRFYDEKVNVKDEKSGEIVEKINRTYTVNMYDEIIVDGKSVMSREEVQ